jgi:hypothetical protein
MNQSTTTVFRQFVLQQFPQPCHRLRVVVVVMVMVVVVVVVVVVVQ